MLPYWMRVRFEPSIRGKTTDMDTKDTIEDRCEACFGTKHQVEMKPMRFGQKIVAPPICKVCNGTGQKTKVR
jgi:DnaJ-class molecular chaperone